MANKKSIIGKLIAFTTATAAIGGLCYVFRDKIKESPLFQTACRKADNLYGSVKSKFDDDDFLFDDDWDDFSDFEDDNTNSGETGNREYTTISPASTGEHTPEESENINDSAIPTIDLSNSSAINNSSESPSSYENEGLSDTSEDPDVLEDQDKLDF